MMELQIKQGFKNIQRDIVDHAQLQKFKDFEKNALLKQLFDKFTTLMSD